MQCRSGRGSGVVSLLTEYSFIALNSLMCLRHHRSRRQTRNNEILRRGHRSTDLCSVLHKPRLAPPREQSRPCAARPRPHSAMDSLIFYQPLSALNNQPVRSSAACAASATSATPIAFVPTNSSNARPAVSQRGKEEIGKDRNTIKCIGVSDPAQGGYLQGQRACGDNLVEVQGTVWKATITVMASNFV